MLRLLVVSLLLIGSVSHAASSSGGGFGIHAGMGVPFLTQAGVDFKFSKMWSVSASYNVLDVDVGSAGAKLAMPEVLLNVHPFSGAYFIGVGVGKESLEVTAVETGGTDQIKIEVDAMTTVIKTGWQWGLANGGFWFGIDVSYIIPSSPETKITATGVPTTDPAYIDAKDAADKFGETSFANITFARFGWVF